MNQIALQFLILFAISLPSFSKYKLKFGEGSPRELTLFLECALEKIQKPLQSSTQMSKDAQRLSRNYLLEFQKYLADINSVSTKLNPQNSMLFFKSQIYKILLSEFYGEKSSNRKSKSAQELQKKLKNIDTSNLCAFEQWIAEAIASDLDQMRTLKKFRKNHYAQLDSLKYLIEMIDLESQTSSSSNQNPPQRNVEFYRQILKRIALKSQLVKKLGKPKYEPGSLAMIMDIPSPSESSDSQVGSPKSNSASKASQKSNNTREKLLDQTLQKVKKNPPPWVPGSASP